MICDKDCLHCKYPDCINDTLDYADYQALDRLEKEIIRPKTEAQRQKAAWNKAYREANRDKIAAQQKAYREANRDKIAARKKAYYEANREKVAAQQKAYREANREKVAARNKAYREANREKIAAYKKAYYEANREKIAAQKKIRTFRCARGLSLGSFAAQLGVSASCVSLWELCKVPANWTLIQSVYPDLVPNE